MREYIPRNAIEKLAFEAGLSLRQLASRAGLSANTVYKHVRGDGEIPDNVLVGTLRRMAAAAGKRVVIAFEETEGD